MRLVRGDGRRPRVTVSGSFRRSLAEIEEAVALLGEAGAEVLSPEDPRAVGELDGFVFVASDRSRVIRLLQQRHFAAISASDYLWVVAPEGRVGLSVCLEIGHALACSVPVYCSEVPKDLTVRSLVGVASTAAAPLIAYAEKVSESRGTLLLDPDHAIDEGHRLLSDIGDRVSGRLACREPVVSDPALHQAASGLTVMLSSFLAEA
ncbi:hypothetical protein [Mycobacterium sp. 141]|uniref:hypothetical protein n=1 Tax=Mycobacterium sp. 141 TaxID=1120797 RepID=UPI0012DCD325|nr:hypothetical protein [Mycobacterium sp. 141]